jgi:hypothetical protein
VSCPGSSADAPHRQNRDTMSEGLLPQPGGFEGLGLRPIALTLTTRPPCTVHTRCIT